MSCWFSRLLSRTSNIGLLSLEPILTPGPAPSGVSKLSLDKLLDKSDKRLQNNSRRTNGSCAAARRIWITTLGFGATLALKPNPYEAHGKTGHTPLARSCSLIARKQSGNGKADPSLDSHLGNLSTRLN